MRTHGDHERRVRGGLEGTIPVAEQDGQIVRVVVGDDDVCVPILVQVGQGEVRRVWTSRGVAEAGQPAFAVAAQDGELRIASANEVKMAIFVKIGRRHISRLHSEAPGDKLGLRNCDRLWGGSRLAWRGCSFRLRCRSHRWG